MSRRGFTLVEVLVALSVLAVGVTAVQRLGARSIAAIDADARASRAMLLARTLLAEARLAPPEPGHTSSERGGLPFERDVAGTLHPALREVHVRVSWREGSACELVELVRVPTS
jgi:general secretion pathway protein I